MREIIKSLKNIYAYWVVIISSTIVFESVGIKRYYDGYIDQGKLIIHESYNLWFWGVLVFITTLIIGLIFVPKINKLL